MDASWMQHRKRICQLLAGMEVSGAEAEALSPDEGFAQWRTLTAMLRQQRQTIYLIGNGASASMASHMAADLAKNARLHTQVFTDVALITAISNDMGYDQVFVEPLRRRASAGDMLVAISSSGASPNVLAAVDWAREHELNTVTLSAMQAGNPLRQKGVLNFYIPAQTYSEAETSHAAVLHYWMDLVEIDGQNGGS